MLIRVNSLFEFINEQRESRRKAFVRHSSNAEIADPIRHKMTVNTGKMSIPAAVEAVIAAGMATLVNIPQSEPAWNLVGKA